MIHGKSRIARRRTRVRCSYLEVDLVSRGSDTRFRELGYGFKSDRERRHFHRAHVNRDGHVIESARSLPSVTAQQQ